MNSRFLQPIEIPKVHQKAGIYLGVTRMDAQGVSMCEAMSSGLPTVSFLRVQYLNLSSITKRV
ncbi:hypothetical protein ACOBV8_06130 [Pseudoalteromonas espejiana]